MDGIFLIAIITTLNNNQCDINSDVMISFCEFNKVIPIGYLILNALPYYIFKLKSNKNFYEFNYTPSRQIINFNQKFPLNDSILIQQIIATLSL